MQVKGFIETSFVDWDGRISSVVFTPGCNFRCPFCHNAGLVLNPEEHEDYPLEEIFKFLNKHNDFVDGVVITGGEPTLQPGLKEFCKKIKALGIGIKLDTNGTNPALLKELVNEKLVDYVAMDYKAPLADYKKAIGVETDTEKIKESASILMDSDVDYEFRTTVVPSIHTKDDIDKISQEINGANLLVLQKFFPGHCLDSSLNSLKPQTDEEMEELKQTAEKNVNAKWRGH
jgi:pyruvate formate lyase activating enzyme